MIQEKQEVKVIKIIIIKKENLEEKEEEVIVEIEIEIIIVEEIIEMIIEEITEMIIEDIDQGKDQEIDITIKLLFYIIINFCWMNILKRLYFKIFKFSFKNVNRTI